MYMLSVSVLASKEPSILNAGGLPRVRFFAIYEAADPASPGAPGLGTEVPALAGRQVVSVDLRIADPAILNRPRAVPLQRSALVDVQGYWSSQGVVDVVELDIVRESHLFSDAQFVNILNRKIDLVVHTAMNTPSV